MRFKSLFIYLEAVYTEEPIHRLKRDRDERRLKKDRETAEAGAKDAHLFAFMSNFQTLSSLWSSISTSYHPPTWSFGYFLLARPHFRFSYSCLIKHLQIVDGEMMFLMKEHIWPCLMLPSYQFHLPLSALFFSIIMFSFRISFGVLSLDQSNHRCIQLMKLYLGNSFNLNLHVIFSFENQL